MKVEDLLNTSTVAEFPALEAPTQQQELRSKTTNNTETDGQLAYSMEAGTGGGRSASPRDQQQLQLPGLDSGQPLQTRARPSPSPPGVPNAAPHAQSPSMSQQQQHGTCLSGAKRPAAAAEVMKMYQAGCPAAGVGLAGIDSGAAANIMRGATAGEMGASHWPSYSAASGAKRQRQSSAALDWQPSAAPAGQQLQQPATCIVLPQQVTAGTSGPPSNPLWSGQVPGSFPLMASAVARGSGMPFNHHGLVHQPLPATAGVLPHHITGMPSSWPAARPVLGLPDNTIQVAAAAAAAAAATATRAAMGQDPALGWTPAMAAAAMVAAAGAHEGAAVTAAAAAPRLRHHGQQTIHGHRQLQPAGKDEDISSRQGSLRVLGRASVDGATKGISAELSDAAQPPAAATAATLNAPLDYLGGGRTATSPTAIVGMLQQHLERHLVLPNGPVQAAAGISRGSAAAQVLGAADASRPQRLPPAAAEIAGSPSMDRDPVITDTAGVAQHGLTGPVASPVAAAAQAGNSSGLVGGRHDLPRRFQQEQQQQQLMCLAALGPNPGGAAAVQHADGPAAAADGTNAVCNSGAGWQQTQPQLVQQGLGHVQLPALRSPAQWPPISSHSQLQAVVRSGSEAHSHSPSQQGIPSGHDAARLPAVAGGVRPIVVPGPTAAQPAAAAGTGVPVVTLPPPAALLQLSTAQHPSLPHHLAVQHDAAVTPAPLGTWMQQGQCWQPPWSTAAASGSEHAAHHIAGAGAMRGLPVTPTVAPGHLPPLLPGAALHPVAPVHPAAPGQLLPVATGLGHTAGARAPEPVTPAEASMTSAAARLQQLQQHEPATQTPSAVTAADVPHHRDPTAHDTEQTLAEVSRQLLQQVEQQQQAAAVAAAADLQLTKDLGDPDGAAAAAVLYQQFSNGFDLSVPVAVGWVGAQQPVLDAKVPAQLLSVLAETNQQQQMGMELQQEQQQKQQQADGIVQPQQLGNSGGSTGTEQQLPGRSDQASQQQQQQGSGSNGNGSNGSGNGEMSVAAHAGDAAAHPGAAALPPPLPRVHGAAATTADKQDGAPDTQQAAAAAVAIADANTAAVAIAAAAVAAAANVAAQAAAATGVSGTAQSTGTHLLGYARVSGNGSGGTGGSGSNGLHGSNTLASTALQGSNGNGSNGNGSNGNGSHGNGSKGNASGTVAVAGGGSDGSGSGQNGSQSEPAQPPPASAAAAAQQQLLQAMLSAGLPASAAPNTPAAAVTAAGPGAVPLCTAGVLNAPSCGRPQPQLITVALARLQQHHLQPAASSGHQLQQQQEQQHHAAAAPFQHSSSWLPVTSNSVQPQAQVGATGQQQQQQSQLLASLAAFAAAQGGHQQPTPQQQQQASWWQQQQLLLAQQACQWQTGLTQQAALLQHLPAAVAAMGLHGLTQHRPGSGLLGTHCYQPQIPQHTQQQAAAAITGVAGWPQQQFAVGQLAPPAQSQPVQVVAAKAGNHTGFEAAAAPILHAGRLPGGNVLAELNGSGAAALMTDATGGAAGDTSAGGNGSGGTGGATGATAGTAGGTAHGSGGTGGTGGTCGTGATYGTAGMYGSVGASWGVNGSNTVGHTGLTSGNAAAGSSLAAGQYDGAGPTLLPNAFCVGHHSGGLHPHHMYSSHCAENTLGAAGLPASVSQQQQQQQEGHAQVPGHHMQQSAAAQQQQQQFLQQCQSLMQQKMLAGCQQQTQQQQQPPPLLQQLSPPVNTMAATVRSFAVAGCNQAAAAAPAAPSIATANPALSGQGLSLQSLMWLQQNAASAVQHYQDLQHVQQHQQQPCQHGIAGPIKNTAALNSWVPSMLPLHPTGTAIQPNAALAVAAAAAADGESGGADGSGGGTGGTGGGTGKGSNDPEGTAAAGVGGGTVGVHPSLVASSSWMPSNLHQQQQAWHHDPAAALPATVQQQRQTLVGQPCVQQQLQSQVPTQLLQQHVTSQLPAAMPAAVSPMTQLQGSALQTPALAAGTMGMPGQAAAAGAAGGGSSAGGSIMGLGNLLAPMSSGLAAQGLPGIMPGLGAVAGGGSGYGLAGALSMAATLVPAITSGMSMWPSSLTNIGLGFPAHELLPAATLLQQIAPNAAWADLGTQTAACFNAGLSPSLYWQYLTAAALLAQPPNSAAMVNAAKAYHYFQHYLNPSMVSDWLEDRTPSLASSAASEESIKESPNIERADRVSEAVDVQMEESDPPPAAAAAAGGDLVADKAAACAGAHAVGGTGVAASVGGRVGRKRTHAVETDSEQDEASSRRKYK